MWKFNDAWGAALMGTQEGSTGYVRKSLFMTLPKILLSHSQGKEETLSMLGEYDGQFYVSIWLVYCSHLSNQTLFYVL